MNYLFENARVFRGGQISEGSVSICDGVFHAGRSDCAFDRIISLKGYTVFPGFADVHVHFREPGFSYKATRR